ncbi:MAG TPA: TonB-dependent receptor, partial [Pyrinomonadaceae bacterium]|nr:TonB-dependent receptor [Pyrinomonadaceae bacterium]
AGASFGGSLTEKVGLAGTLTGNQSRRFLDPVDPRNFNNRGGRIGLNLRSDWQPTANDLLLFSLSLNGSDFRLTNELEQELAGQRQRQELRDDRQTFRWQRVWSPSVVTDLALYRQSYGAKLFGSSSDTPLFAEQDRRHTRQGLIASLTHLWRGHTLKTGFEAARVSLREFFTFAVTDEEDAREREISEAALEFDVDDPFVFRDRAARYQFSAYFQDNFQLRQNLTLSLGVRYDRSRLLVRDEQLSPRLGAAYYLPRTKTVVRGSFNRLYAPPQVENLLLASSEQARQLSPFAAPEEGGAGGAEIRPEIVSAYEVGFAQDLWGWFKIDGAYWHRTFRNYDDPNVFFNTTVIFPNSVASGFARGADARLDFPARRGWSGYLSYSNARVLQYGPINGGLFLTDEFIEIGPGTPFIPDHDVRNAVAFGVTYAPPKRRAWASLMGRYETGVPLEVTEERLEELCSLPGADLVDFDRRRVKPWSIFDFSVGGSIFEREKYSVGAQFDIQNIANKRYVYNFGSPFSGTHFGHPRLWGGRVRFTLK